MEFKKDTVHRVSTGLAFSVAEDMNPTQKMDKEAIMGTIKEIMQTAYTGCLEAETEAEYHSVVLAVTASCDGCPPSLRAMLVAVAGSITAAWIVALREGGDSFESKRRAACINLAKTLRTIRDSYAELIDTINSKVEENNTNV